MALKNSIKYLTVSLGTLTLILGCSSMDNTTDDVETDSVSGSSAPYKPSAREFDHDTSSGTTIDTSDEPADDIEVPLQKPANNVDEAEALNDSESIRASSVNR